MCQIEACLHDMVDTEAASHNKHGLPNANCNGSTVAHLLGKSLIEFEGNKSKSINDVGEEEVVVEGSGMGKRSNEGSCLENATVNESESGKKNVVFMHSWRIFANMMTMFVCSKLQVCKGCWFNFLISRVKNSHTF
ncbi:hypothetical protein KIW84_036220 [Lathyrus oleraceus]|uniref:Uncharacterized protein n=1 Tax=Pisum sativum TaxID=3888 RepID=A0A9D4Y4A9_PEA|nr:hypothetical protein KIW84_036220 [Pisum sativum]